ncbi:hypothetical protein [Duganella fentianensis]|uniref:hypothetical protein n=1 Tax=Duganella fentianensis TaxID=2692177 RepID=UPI0032B156C8
MSISKARTKLASPKGELQQSKAVHTTHHVQFAVAVTSIAQRYGVKVASLSIPTKNPYAMSAEQAINVARQAGIITQAGNLARKFK